MRRAFGSTSPCLCVPDAVRLRREHFGGILLDTRTGTTADVDRAAFTLLAEVHRRGIARLDDLLPHPGGSDRDGRPALESVALVRSLLDLGLLEMASPGPEACRPSSAGDALVPRDCLFEAMASHGRTGSSTAGNRGVDALMESASLSAKPPDSPVADYTEADGPPWAAPAAARPDAWPPGPHLTAPETVHWAMTYACAAGCPDCYARRHRHRFPDEMSTGDALRLVDRLAAWGVFQVAIGGGEPLERPDLPEVAAHARRLGLVVHVTTGRHQVDGRLLDRLAAGVSVLQFGVKAEPLLGDPAVAEALEASVAGARAMGIHTAANVMLSRGVIARFEEVLSALAPAGLRQVTLLRYKPPANVERWLREKPSTETLRAFEVDLPGVLARHPDLSLRVDCALSFLQRRVGPAAALAAGVRGCVAGQRILALAPDGSAFPCSQLVHPDQRAGSALEDDLERLWSASPVLRRYRLFRDNPEFCRTACGVCTARDHCGGCRVFAADAWGAEPECPDPILPPLEKMGKNGRLLDLERYLAEHLWITVGEYMQRYGVLQERAVKDLRAASCTVAPVEGTGRKQSDCYYSAREVEVLSLQESIGCTSGGWPFVSREEILAWQAHWNGADHEHYPRWLLPTTRQEAPAQGKNESHDHGVGPAGSAGSDRADRAPTGEWRGDPECGDPFTEETPPAIEPRRRKGQR